MLPDSNAGSIEDALSQRNGFDTLSVVGLVCVLDLRGVDALRGVELLGAAGVVCAIGALLLSGPVVAR